MNSAPGGASSHEYMPDLRRTVATRHGRPHLLRVTRKQNFSFRRLTAMLDFGSGSRITLRVQTFIDQFNRN